MNIGSVVDAILEVAQRRKTALEQLRMALQSGENDRAIVIARELCGLDNEESHRVNPRIN
jgi:hypothetical protein